MEDNQGSRETTMSNGNNPAPSPCTSAVIFHSKSEAVVLPGGMVSVAGVTVVTGGAELTWGSCLLAFGVWGTLTGVSVALLGIWDQWVHRHDTISRLLIIGLVVLAINLGVIGSVVGYRCGRKKREADDGKLVLVGDGGSGCVKTVTV